MNKITFSGFADEISPDLKVQLDTLEAEKIRYLELRGVWGKSVMALTDEELDQVKRTLDERGIGVSAIGSPIGKVGIDDDFEEHLAQFRRALEIAQKMETRYIRLFSFYLPPGENPLRHRDEVMRRMRGLVEVAEGTGITLLHENEKRIYGESSDRCLDILKTVNHPRLRAIFDFANFVQAGEHPYDDGFPKLRPYIEYIHVKDALLETGQVVPPGEGDGQLAPIFRDLTASGWTGFISLEPHLIHAGHSRGFSGPELFRKAAQMMKKILDDLGAAYE